MKFLVKIDVKGLQTIDYVHSAKCRFKEMPHENILVATNQSSTRSICFRDGNNFDDVLYQKGPGDSITLSFDDFVPGLTAGNFPEWYEKLRSRIISVDAQEQYGHGQGIKVTERKIHGSATARVRHQQVSYGGDLCYCVKIHADGVTALAEAMMLHELILKGE